MAKRLLYQWKKKVRRFIFDNPHWKPHFNGRMLLDKAVLKTILQHSFMLVWFLVLIEIGKTWVCNHDTLKIDVYFAEADKFLYDENGVNILLTITVLTIIVGWLIHVWKDRFLSLIRVDIAVGLLTILTFAGATFTNINSILGVDYFSLWSMALIVQLCIEGKKLWNKRWSAGTIYRIRGLHYITEQPQEGLDRKVRADYAKKVVAWLFNTDISESSFAVGITSEWGSGKTSFLLDMTSAMKGKCYMVDFKPWHCQEPDQIVNEFFELLRKKIKDVYSPLQKPIIRYAQLLSEVDVPMYVNPLFRLLPEMGHSIERYKNKIEEGLKQIDKPIVVTIDDMDRLAADEMFEVLRLIRNTAAFPNLIYVVCYDKDYVVRQIQNKGIAESDLYLEKIFPLELSLPKTEEEALIETLRRALIDMHYLNGKHDSLRSRMTAEDELMLVRLLPTYRKIKRFARVLMTNTMFVIEKVGRKNIDLYDIFLIELVHFCMQDVYVILRDRPEELLDVEMDTSTRQARYVLKKDILNEDAKMVAVNRSLNRYEEELLRKCFKIRGGDKTHFLAYVDSYQNYFCMATPDAMITKREFVEVVSDRSNVRLNVHNWFWRLPIKKSASLYSRMMCVRIKELTLEQWKDHIYLLFAWMCEAEDDTIKDVLAQYLLIENLHVEVEDADVLMKQYALEKLTKLIDSRNVNRFNVGRNLSGYYHIAESKKSKYLLNCDDVKNVLTANFKKFMSEKQAPQDAINVVAINGNDLNEFVKAHDIREDSRDDYGDLRRKHQNLIIDDVISYFGAYEEKSGHLKDAKAIYKFGQTRYKLPYIDVDMKEEKSALFGNDANYERYLKECFEQKEKEL